MSQSICRNLIEDFNKEECIWGSRIRTADGEEGRTRGRNQLGILQSEQNCPHVFVISSESIAPSNPNKAPDAPTDTRSPRVSLKQDIRLPPSPEMTYKAPILTVISPKILKLDKEEARILMTEKRAGFLQNPNSCSRRIPIQSRLIILASK